jgi:ABC-2 type transport system ATP-binding protein
MLATLIFPTSGTARLNGYDIKKDELKIKSSVGFAGGDERSFYWRLTGRQNLKFYSALYNIGAGQTERKIDELINLLGIDCPDKNVGEYSAGMKQRLNIARALLHNPSILLMDEPTKSLDPETVKKFHSFLREELSEKQGKTILFTTHNTEEANSISTRIGKMENGKLKCETAD